MSKKKAPESNQDNLGFDTVEQSLTKTEQFLENNARQVATVVGALVVVVLLIFGYKKYIVEPNQKSAAKEMAQAIKWFEADSMNLALNGNGSHYGMLDIIDEYGGTPAGKAAHYYAGMAYYNLGQFEDAIATLDKYPTKDVATSATALGTIGDAFVELGQMDDAVDFYVKAANATDNDFTTPLFLWKAALAYEALDKGDKALELYEKIAENYPKSRQAAGLESIIASKK